MNVRIVALRRMVTWIWDGLTEPFASVEDAERRFKSRWVSATLISLVGFGLLVAAFSYWVRKESPFFDPSFFVSLIAIGIWLIAYWISRRGAYEIAALISVIVGSVVIFIEIILTQPIRYSDSYYLLLPILFLVVLGSRRIVLISGILSMMVVTVFGLVATTTTLERIESVVAPVRFLVFGLALTLLLIHYYETIERLRAKALAESNRNLQDEIARREQTETELKWRLRELEILNQVSKMAISSSDIHQVLKEVARLSCAALDMTSGYICDIDFEKGTTTVLAKYLSGQASAKERIPDQGITYRLETDFPQLVPWIQNPAGDFVDQVDDPDIDPYDRDELMQYGIKTSITMPLVVNENPIGYLELWESRSKRHITEEEIQFLQSIANQVAMIMANAHLHQDLRESEALYRSLVELLPYAVTVSQGGKYAYANSACIKLLGAQSVDDLIGMTTLDRAYAEDRERVMKIRKQLIKKPEPVHNILTRATRLNGEVFDVEISATQISYRNQPAILSVFHDVSERLRVEEQLKSSLREKEALLREIHHRVKNNLQIISSLLSLQSMREAQSGEAHRESQSRILSMALIHEQLYQTSDLSRIDVRRYLGQLTEHLLRSYRPSDCQIHLQLEADDIQLDVDTAIPCGLIISELVSNALKHAFPDGRAGEIVVSFKRDGDEGCRIEVRDDGVGFRGEINHVSHDSLGLQLVMSLTEQLGGVLEHYQESGSWFVICFSDAERVREKGLGASQEKADG